MRTSMQLLTVAFILAFLCPSPALAQDYPQLELFGGFSYARMGGMNRIGWNVSGAKNMSYILGIAMDVARLNGSQSDASSDYREHLTTFMAGPRVTSRDAGKLAPFMHLLLGVAHNSYEYELKTGNTVIDSISGSNNGFAMSLGGGIDMRARGPLAFRVVQVDYMGYRMQGYWTKGWRLSVGLALRIGGNP